MFNMLNRTHTPKLITPLRGDFLIQRVSDFLDADDTKKLGKVLKNVASPAEMTLMHNHYEKQIQINRVLNSSLEEFQALINNPDIANDIVAHGVTHENPNIQVALINSQRPLSDSDITRLINHNMSQTVLIDHTAPRVCSILINSHRKLSPAHITQLINHNDPSTQRALINSHRKLLPEHIIALSNHNNRNVRQMMAERLAREAEQQR